MTFVIEEAFKQAQMEVVWRKADSHERFLAYIRSLLEAQRAACAMEAPQWRRGPDSITTIREDVAKTPLVEIR